MLRLILAGGGARSKSDRVCVALQSSDRSESVFMAGINPDIQYEGHLNTPEVAGLSP